jgi:hypothetical protein
MTHSGPLNFSDLQDPVTCLGFVDRNLPEDVTPELVGRMLRSIHGTAIAAEDVDLSDDGIDALLHHRVLTLLPTEIMGADVHRRIAATQMRLNALLRDIVAIAHEVGVEPRVVKGLATANLDFPNPLMRHTGDIDVLIRPVEFERFHNALQEHGSWTLIPTQIDEQLDKGLALVNAHGFELDIHTRWCRYVQQDVDVMIASSEPLNNHNALALSRDLRLLHSAAHVAYSKPGGRRLSGLTDISAIRDSEEIDMDALRQTASGIGMEEFAAVGLQLEATLTGRADQDLQVWSKPTGLVRRAFLRTDRAVLAEHLLAARATEGLHNRIRYLGSFAVPGNEVLSDRGGLKRYFGKVFTG